MNKFLSIFCLTLFLSATLAKKSATEQAAETAAELKDKVVEKVRFPTTRLLFLFGIHDSSSRSKMRLVPPMMLLHPKLLKVLNIWRKKPKKLMKLEVSISFLFSSLEIKLNISGKLADEYGEVGKFFQCN